MQRRRTLCHGPGGGGAAAGGNPVALETGASPAEGPRRGPGHGGVAAGPCLLGPAEGRGRGCVLCEGRQCQRVCLPGGAQLPRAGGFLAFREVPFLVDAVRRLQEREPHLMPQAGPSCGWKRCAPPPRLWGGLPPRHPHRPALCRGGQETAAGGWAGEQRPAQGEDTTSTSWGRHVSSDGRLRDHPGHGEPGGSCAPDPRVLQVPDSRACAAGRHPLPRLHPQDPGSPQGPHSRTREEPEGAEPKGSVPQGRLRRGHR
ncbi:endonuclease V isoform X7 [Manis javanica]|uniref:endonuclease V isoform X7 n=1 Tax=Manis javanica TaxID=9974 RepID=UPI003C6D8617